MCVPMSGDVPELRLLAPDCGHSGGGAGVLVADDDDVCVRDDDGVCVRDADGVRVCDDDGVPVDDDEAVVVSDELSDADDVAVGEPEGR